MKKLLLLPILLCSVLFLNSQSTQLFVEDFQSGTSSFTLNSGGPGSNSGSNQWIINNQYSGAPTYPNTMPEDSTYSGTIGFAPYSKYLHIYDQPSGITNGNYDPTNASDHFAYMTNGICTMGMDSVHFSFFYLCQGSSTAYGQVYYSANNGPWIQVGLSQYNNKYKWKYEDITDPAFSNVQNLRFGFRWQNNSGAAVNSESFCIDDIDIVGVYNSANPITITVDSLSPNPVCQGGFLWVYFHISDTLCDGTYQIELSNSAGTFTGANNWVYNMYYPQTSAAVPLILPTSLPAGTCYKIRVSRTSPPPAIVGTATACFSIIACPNVITTLQPVVTFDTNAVCVGSAIDIPFYSTGAYSFNTYSAEISDSNGVFPSTPTVIGTWFNSGTYDPMLGSPPGSVSGQVPNVPPGCGYYLRVVSSNPAATGAPWGPFCIGDCDITTNNKIDLHFCVTDCNISPAPVDTLIDIDVNTFDSTAVYNPGNIFTTQLMSSQTFGQIGPNGILGSVAATGDTTLNMHIPCKDSLAYYGIPVGMNYVRVTATNSSVPDNSLGSLIRLTIGAPHGNGEVITSYDYSTFMPRDTFCVGDVVALFFNPYNYSDNSTYQWICNQINGGNPFTSPSGANSNSLYVNLGAAGVLTFKVQETNYGCTGPWSPVDTVWVLAPPSVLVIGPSIVCQGDTNNYHVPFANNTYYNWGANGGSIVDTSNNVIDMAYPNTGTFQVTITAVNECGSASAVKNVTVKPYPIVNAGSDTTICLPGTVSLSTPTGTGYNYNWTSSPAGTSASSSAVTVSPTVTTTYFVKVGGPGSCYSYDTVTVFVQTPPAAAYADSVCPGGAAGSITLMADTTGSYLWSTGDTTSQITVSDTGVYTLTISSPGEVCSRILTYNVTAVPCPIHPELLLPNIFSPNGDGLNEFFTPVTTGDFDKFNIKIFNRWGQLMFESDDPHFKWNGQNKQGKAAPDGTYYYIAKVALNGEDLPDMKSYFMLTR